MKIAFLFWGAGEGGDASALLALASELKNRGKEFAVFAYAYAKPEVFKAKAIAGGLEEGKDLFFTEEPGNFWLGTGLSPADFDILDVHHGRTIPKRTDITPIRKAAGDLPIVFTAHGPLPLRTITYGGLKSRISRYISPVWFDALVVPSEAKAREWHQMTPFSRRVRAIHNIVSFFEPRDKQMARKQLGIDPQKKVALYCSRLDEDKDPATFIIALASAAKRDETLLGIMAGEGSLAKECDDLIAELHAPVKRLGYLNDPQLAYSAADLFVQPSLYESFGITLLQAAALGLPCVASDIEIFREFYNDCDSFQWFASGDHKACAEGILHQLASEPNTKQQDILQQRFGAEEVIAAHEQLWQEVLEKKWRALAS